MNTYYKTKHWLKVRRWLIRRWLTQLKYGKEQLEQTPVVVGNAMPKSGSHLIIQVLQGLTKIGPFVNPGFSPINRGEDNSNLKEEEIMSRIQCMLPGDIAYGYLHAREPYLSALTATGKATIFIYRDPRDMIISHVFYATQMHKGHGMNPYYTQWLDSMEERINAAIKGVKESGYELSSIRAKYNAYLGWLRQPEVLSLPFEELINNRERAFLKIIEFLQTRGFSASVNTQTYLDNLEKSIQPKKSGTFRRGKPGNWKEYFTPSNIKLFKELTGDLLITLGYEQDGSW